MNKNFGSPRRVNVVAMITLSFSSFLPFFLLFVRSAFSSRIRFCDCVSILGYQITNPQIVMSWTDASQVRVARPSDGQDYTMLLLL